MDYVMITGDAKTLEKKVNELSDYGFQLYGNPMYQRQENSGTDHFAQAMIRVTKPVTEETPEDKGKKKGKSR